jgi:hypothetical protein
MGESKIKDLKSAQFREVWHPKRLGSSANDYERRFHLRAKR